ncbi:MAG: hypothetical protein O2841_06450 [Actinomycetota bacterium]|nr:hypothetical protein [Actinomycetota bacterium]
MNPLETPRRISFDLETFAEVARKKWWIVPLTMLIGLTLMFWQESDLQTEAPYFSLTRVYEPTDEGAPLTLVGVNTDLISQFPDETNLVLFLESAEIKQKIQANFDREINLLVKQLDKTFSLNTQTDGGAITKFSFKPSRRFSYELTCVEEDEKNCAGAIDLYAQELQSIRLIATKAGFANSMKLIDSLLAADIQLSPDDLSRLNLQRNAFDQAIDIASGEIIQISESKYFGGETVGTVDRRSYIFGLLVGLIFGIIILIQFVVTDSKIRSARSLITATSYEKYLGEATSTADSNSLQLLAAALRGSSPNKIESIKILPVGAETVYEKFATDLAQILGARVSITKPFGQLTAADLTPSNGAVFLLAVVKNSANVSELKQIWSVIEKSGNIVLGSALITQ